MSNDEGGTDDEEFRVVAVKDRANVTAQVWMGLTMGCAQCHTHKYDPITQREYYSFYGFFNQTEDADRPDEQPLLEVWTEQQEQQKKSLTQQVAKLEEQLKQDTPELKAGAEKWATAALEQERTWVVLDPTTFASAGGATVTEQPDHSLLVSGKRADVETYTVAAPTHLNNITAVRIEALPDGSLPMGGPGRAENGGFVLNSFKLSVAPAEPKPAAGRFVRIELPGKKKILALAEVQVFSGGQNVALKGTASQSTTAFDGDAKLAIDGNTDGQFSIKSTTHTAESDNPWWEVDLGRAQPLEKIAVWNRVDNNLGFRLKDARVIILDDARKPVWDSTIDAAPSPSTELVVGGARAVTLQNASADYWQTEGGDFSAAKAIDKDGGPKSGWAVSSQVGRPHAAVFETASDIGDTAGAVLTFAISHTAPGASLGKFRLSVTTAPRSVRALPGPLASVLTIPPERRGDDQKAELLAYYRTFAPELKPLRDQVAQANVQIAAIKPTPVPVMRELPAEKQRKTYVMVKGNFLAKGDEVKPTVLAAFHPLPKDAPMNRLGVARWLVCDDNPLTARVYVNRLWAQLFGLGLVETQEDFGTQGQPPTHPELLDWLATEFQQTLKWDQKAMLKRLVMSATYRQASVARPDAAAKDPRNRLLARFPRLRVEAEMVRDQALALSGLLSHKMLGPSVYPPQPEGLWQAAFNGERTWATSTGEDRYRRGIYTFWRRTVPYPSMAAFDAPSREVCTVRRIPSNTPLQAFVTLNDPVYVEAAQALARRIAKEGGGDAETRAKYGLELCQSRPPTVEQVKYVIELYNAELERYRADKPAAEQLATEPLGKLPEGIESSEAAAWTVVSNVLLNLDAVLTKG